MDEQERELRDAVLAASQPLPESVYQAAAAGTLAELMASISSASEPLPATIHCAADALR